MLFIAYLIIEVVNSSNGTYKYNSKGDFITTKTEKNHGHGLKRIDIVVDKYGGFIKRANEPGVFATEIMLPL